METIKKANEFRLGISGIIIAPIGYAVLLFMPIYLEVAAESLGFNNRQIGLFASTDACGLALATLMFSLWLKKLNFHHLAAAGITITVLGNLISTVINDFGLLCAVRVVTGLGEGLMVAVGVSAVSMTSNPNRWFGIYTAVVVIVQAIGLLIVPPVYALWQLPGVFSLIAGVYLLPLLVVKALPKWSVVDDSDGANNSGQGIARYWLVLALLGLLLFYICIGGVWAYLSFMGTDSGLTLSYVSKALSIALIGGLSGAVFFALLGRHGANHFFLFSSSSALAACLWLLNDIENGITFTLILVAFNFFWSIIGARLFAVIADADHSGAFISAAQTVVGIGFVLGPVFASMLVTGYGYLGINAMGILAMALCFVAVTPLVMITRRTLQTSIP